MKLGENPTITIKRAHEILGWINSDMDLLTLQAGVDQEKLPFGVCVLRSQRVFKVSKLLLSDWVFKWCGARLTFEGELFKIAFDDGVLREEIGEDGKVRVKFDAFEKVQVAV